MTMHLKMKELKQMNKGDELWISYAGCEPSKVKLHNIKYNAVWVYKTGNNNAFFIPTVDLYKTFEDAKEASRKKALYLAYENARFSRQRIEAYSNCLRDEYVKLKRWEKEIKKLKTLGKEK